MTVLIILLVATIGGAMIAGLLTWIFIKATGGDINWDEVDGINHK